MLFIVSFLSVSDLENAEAIQGRFEAEMSK